MRYLGLIVLTGAVLVASPALAFYEHYAPKEYKILKDNPDDEYNGVFTGLVVRPKDSKEFNRRGYGIVTQYGGGDISNWVNVQFKNSARAYNPFEIEKVEVKSPPCPPEWFIKRNYHWFYDDAGNKQSNWKQWKECK